MKAMLGFLAGTIFACVVASSAFAQTAPDTIRTLQWTKPDGTQVTLEANRGSANLDTDQLRAFQNATLADPAIAPQLAKNPRLIASARYVSRHPALKQFLAQYPNAREELQTNPGNYLVPVRGSTWTASATGKTSAPMSD